MPNHQIEGHQQATWQGEKINFHPGFGSAWYAFLDGYDPTPWDSETPARGPHSRFGCGDTAVEAIADLLEKLEEYEPATDPESAIESAMRLR